MAFFKKKKTEENIEKKTDSMNDTLKDDISKAYDEIMSKGKTEEKTEQPQPVGNFESEVLKSKIKAFKESKTQQALLDVMNMLPGRAFLVPSVSNMEEPFEIVDGKMKLKEGAVINPALLTGSDEKIFLPIFTEESEMVQKSPSGVVLRYSFEQCVSIVYNKNNPVGAIVINPFTENMIFGEDLLRMAFKEQKKED